ncbi:DUF1090 domain-containing protein [Shewanella sp. VB17]|uniref:DUF1090 domain-containing protein n=1 Tax=Shewanella sp. VB17 TaxID=2739432 RepID=UPI001563758C|nr:DUF1090 domain-containing protein [Shewanella sp. VB17]NRD75798.1 DUF1090 domain-containing protein [Shewanella sp. VB17]
MKTLYTVGLCVFLGAASHVYAADCNKVKACERKFCEINDQLSIAKSNNNESKVNGLNKALAYAKNNCSTQGLRDEIQNKIDDASDDIEEYQSDLDEAKADNKKDKIEKYQRKMAEKREQISRLKVESAELE